METTINDPLKSDAFFMENIWEFNDLYHSYYIMRIGNTKYKKR